MNLCFLVPVIFLLFGFNNISAQEADSSGSAGNADTYSNREPSLEEVIPGFRNQAVVLDIEARVLEQDKVEIWNESHKRVTIPGRPVGLKLVGTNIVVAVQFIPYLRRSKKNMLVAQGQIWVDIPNQGIRYQTTMQTIPIEFEEPIYFFPLGPAGKTDEASIEIMITMRPYRDSGTAETQTAQPDANNDQGNNDSP